RTIHRTHRTIAATPITTHAIPTSRSRLHDTVGDASPHGRSPSPHGAHGPTVLAMPQSLVVENDGRLRVLRLNRPERKNALNGELLGAIVGAVRDAAEDHGVWALALMGNGDAFCSGLDLSANDPDEADRASPPDDAVDNFAMIMRIDCEKPILAGVNGVAVGIGVSLAMAADIRIAAPSARFHPGYARVATSPDGGATVTIRRHSVTRVRCGSSSSSAWCRQRRRTISAWSVRSPKAIRNSRTDSSPTGGCSPESHRSRHSRRSGSSAESRRRPSFVRTSTKRPALRCTACRPRTAAKLSVR